MAELPLNLHENQTPWQRLLQLLKEDRRDLLVLVVYVLLNGLLMLAVPLAAQALVNTIAAGIFLQPLAVLSLMLLGVLLFVGMIRLLTLVLVEILQQRIFVRIALRLAYRLPRIALTSVQGKYLPELTNRFFDVMTLQKTWSKILLDGPAAVLQILVGLLLLAFYSPILLAFDLILIFLMVVIIFGLGMGGVSTSIRESARKYQVAGWLEELARCSVSFKLACIPDYTISKTDHMVQNYLINRQQHFKVIFRQAVGTYLLYALVSAGILAIGGWLVIDRQLTLGQLVASEIIVVGVLTALEKLMRLMESFYDLLTGIDKIGHVVDLPLDSDLGKVILEQSPSTLLSALQKTDNAQVQTPGLDNVVRAGISVQLQDVSFSYSDQPLSLNNISLNWRSGQRIGLVGHSGSGKTTMAYLLCGLLAPTRGIVSLNETDVRDIRLDSLRRWVNYAGVSSLIFEGTLEENITLGREWVTPQDVRWALELTELDRDLASLPEGKLTRLVSEGKNLSFGQRQRLVIARAIVDRPKLLILDETLAAIEGEVRARILSRLKAPENSWTLLVITHDILALEEMDTILVLEKGQIVENAPLETLLKNNSPLLQRLFPILMRER